MIFENRSGMTVQPWPIAAPALLMIVLVVSINLLGDAFARSRGRRIASSPCAGVSGVRVLVADGVRVERADGAAIVEDVALERERRDPRARRRIRLGKTTTALALLGYARRGRAHRGGLA